jgi:hypothetical protein
MTSVRALSLLALGICLSRVTGMAGGLDVAAPIGPYLDGALPSRTPTATSGDWQLVRAFPNQTFVDPIELLARAPLEPPDGG